MRAAGRRTMRAGTARALRSVIFRLLFAADVPVEEQILLFRHIHAALLDIIICQRLAVPGV